MKYTISQIEKIFGIPASAIRYYEQHNMLPFLKRNGSGTRYVDAADLSNFNFLLLLKSCGFSLREITNLTEEAENTKKRFAEEDYNKLLQLIDAHAEKLLNRQAVLLEQMRATKFLRWYFDECKNTGDVPHSENYPGNFTMPNCFDNGELKLSVEELYAAYAEKYPNSFPHNSEEG